MPDSAPKPSRKYPAFWEKAVPIFLVILGLAVLALLVVAVGVASGLFKGF